MENAPQVLIVPIIVGVIEALKRAGWLPSRYASLVSLAAGLVASVGSYAAGALGAADAFQAVLQGAAIGLAASGLYSVARATTRTTPRSPSEGMAVGRIPDQAP